MENLNEIVKRLQFSFNVLSYPVLEELKYLRVYNEFIQKSIETKLAEVNTVLSNDSGETRVLDLKLIQAMSNQKMYNSFENILKASLLMAVYSTLENIVTATCSQDDRLSRYNEYKKNKKKSILTIANDFLHEEGFTEIKDIEGWDFIDDMRRIRNRFVHNGGKTNDEINKISNLYDLVIDGDQIILGEMFICNFIKVVECVAVEFAKIVYPEQKLF